MKTKRKKRIGILGGGPSALFIVKWLIESGETDFEIVIFEKDESLGAGMPYSFKGANKEHVTNVSDHETPQIVMSIKDWVKIAPTKILKQFHIDPTEFNEQQVLPRLFFGYYLSAQFQLLLEEAKKLGIKTRVHFKSTVHDISYNKREKISTVYVKGKNSIRLTHLIICTGHDWPVNKEKIVPGYYDSPYPPSKLALKLNHPVALKGSSLTAIDATLTLARKNGTFKKNSKSKLTYQVAKDCPEFKIIMHSRNGLLPSVRFYLEDPPASTTTLLTRKEIMKHISKNDGFLSLDFIFKKDFKEPLAKRDHGFYRKIKNLSMEEFVDKMMELREEMDPFRLLEKEYKEAKRSRKKKESIHWKEALDTLSFAMNYPAKYFSAEDMQRLQKTLMPLISIIIAFVPQKSCDELFALYAAGRLKLISVGDNSGVSVSKSNKIIYRYQEGKRTIETVYRTFIDCTGQPHLSYEDFPFKSLLKNKQVGPARLKFKSSKKAKKQLKKGDKNIEKGSKGEYYLKVPGVAINDDFQLLDQNGGNNHMYMMAVPYIGGFNPDYSGLDFCATASKRIVNNLLSEKP